MLNHLEEERIVTVTREMVEKVRLNMLRLVGKDNRLKRLRNALEGSAGH